MITAYSHGRPIGDRRATGQLRTSGHRGSSLHNSSMNGMCWRSARRSRVPQAARYRRPVVLGTDTHALSEPATASALEVLAANGVELMLAKTTNTHRRPGVARILCYNRHASRGWPRIVITPSHNPPDAGGFKYTPAHGGPADPTCRLDPGARQPAESRRGFAGVRRSAWSRRCAARARTVTILDAYSRSRQT